MNRSNDRRRKIPGYVFENELKKALELNSVEHLFRELVLKVDNATKYLSRFERWGIMKGKRKAKRNYGEFPGKKLSNELSEIEIFLNNFRIILKQVRKQRQRAHKLKKEKHLDI